MKLEFMVEVRGWRLWFGRTQVPEEPSEDPGDATSYARRATDHGGEPHDVSFGFSLPEANSS